ncbi:unnamed protein product [Calicophoron daubneyi]|uniref:CST complex subunit STN1 n=1 Tax=Calicophoron daubneyi TaxID=300641 RepID=A0AAV2THJ3_CALDB
MSLSALDDSRWLSNSTLQLDETVAEKCSSVVLDPLASEYYQLLIGDLVSAEPVENLNIFRLGPRWILYADIVGNVRSLFQREKYTSVEVDDGTGCISCTVWHQSCIIPNPNTSGASSSDQECRRICEQLFRIPLSARARLHLGVGIHLRGRLNWFRGQLNLSAHFYRILEEPREQFLELLHRNRLKLDVYSKPYDPEAVARILNDSQTMNIAQSTASEAYQVMKEDALNTFTKLDLCLNPRIVDALRSNAEAMELDDFEDRHFIPAKETPDPVTKKPANIQTLVETLIKCLLRDGRIYPASDHIFAYQAYHVVFRSTRSSLVFVC